MLLTDAEIDAYRRDGIVIPDYRLSDAMLQRIAAAYDDLLAANAGNPDFSPDFILGPHIEGGYATGTMSNGSNGGGNPWMDFATQPEIVDMVEQVLGPDVILWAVTIFGKPAGVGKATPWHQDGDYYPIEPLETCTVWISLDGSTPENGCMRVVPGSHLERRVFKHHWEERDDLTLAQVIDADQVDLDSGRDVVLEPGQISMHDVYLVHGSNPNRSDRRRMGLVLRYMPGGSFYNHGKGAQRDGTPSAHDYSKRKLFLLRGQDRTGRNRLSAL